VADVEEESARREMERRLAEAMADLPPDQRAVLELHFLENLSHKEIAGRLGITTHASQQRLFKARRALEECLELTLPPTNRGRPRREPSPTQPDPRNNTALPGERS
jgi:DNA-directed RNA polymerase specialized sigma24 family protein